MDCVSLKVASTQPTAAREYLLELGIKRRDVHAIFEEHRLTLDGKALRRTDVVVPGAILELALACDTGRAAGEDAGGEVGRDAGRVTGMVADNLPACQVVYEDGIVLACDKQAGILVHGDGGDTPTLTDVVQAHLTNQGIYRRAQAVQRIDVDTTGLVLFSTAHEFQAALDEQVASGSMHKCYLAVVKGAPSWETRRINAAVGRDRHNAQRMRVCAPGQGKVASTRVRVLAHHDGLTLLEAELETGRRHQIRVHLASVGYPIVGDKLYGGAPDKARGHERGYGHERGRGRGPKVPLMLHAWREEFVHPLSHEPLTIRTAWPERFEHLGFYEDCFV